MNSAALRLSQNQCYNVRPARMGFLASAKPPNSKAASDWEADSFALSPRRRRVGVAESLGLQYGQGLSNPANEVASSLASSPSCAG
jgi:hypothetical protein